MNKITTNMVSAIKVQFKKVFFEDDFVEKGMTAWLTDIEWDPEHDCYKLYFDFTDFESINLKYFKEAYYANKYTAQLNNPNKKLFTAIEAGMYEPKYWSYFYTFYTSVEKRDAIFEDEITEYLRVVE